MEIKSRDKLEPGDVLAKPIYNSNGVALLPAGAVLSESNIDRLRKDYNDISEFFCVDTPGTENIIIEDNIGEEVRIKTSIAIRNKQIREIIEQSKVISHQIINYNIHDVDFYDTRNKSDYVTRHAVNVAIVSCIIAKSMGYSEKELEEITLAGLLHDCAKYLSSEDKISKCESYGIPVSDYERKNPELLHAKLGACFANEIYGVTDSEILSAIIWHTTGCPDMSLLDKIVFIADYIEANRDKAEDLPKVRELAFKDIDACLLLILEDTIAYLARKKSVTDPMTQKTYDYYKERN